MKNAHKCSQNLCVTFHPVAEKVFPALPIVMVRSHIPGRLAVKNTNKQLVLITSLCDLCALCSALALCYLTYLYVLGSIISQPLIHLVSDAQHIMFDTKIGNHLELFSLVNL